jgi:hypothetical protein
MMSNAKLKEQIEAAKIALVHSVEAGTSIDTPQASNTVTQIPTTSGDHAQGQRDRPAEMAHASTAPETSISGDDMASHDGGVAEMAGQEMVPQSDYEKLEARLQELEEQIRNQQRDLHTLLQKLRDITAKSQAAAKPKKSKGAKKWLLGGVLCALGLGAVYYGPGVETITAAVYHLTGLMVALVDTLASKI